ncbi:uncharacterized protein knl1 [Pholidichthys leucotaenia]
MRFSADDAAMDVTKSHTVNIATALSTLSHKNTDLPTCGEKTLKFFADDAAMDVTKSHTVNIATALSTLSHKNTDLPTCGEKTMRFSADDAAMDVTKSHTVNIATALSTLSHKNTDLPTCGEKTLKFFADDAAMDVTKSHTVNIATALSTLSHKNTDLPTCGEKTMKFFADDAAMDVTKSHTVNIATALSTLSHKNTDLPTCGEKTLRFTTDDIAMDVTRSHTVNIATNLDIPPHQSMDLLLDNRDITTRFTAADAMMDVTKSHTVNIATNFDKLSQKSPALIPTCGEKTVRFTAYDAAMDVTHSHTVNISTELHSPSLKNAELLPTCGEKTLRFNVDDVAMDVTQCHTVSIATELCIPPHQNANLLLDNKDTTVSFIADDAAIDMMQSHTVNIATDLDMQQQQSVDSLPKNGETTGFHVDDSKVVATKRCTLNMPLNKNADSLICVEKKMSTSKHGAAQQNMDLIPTGSEKTMTFTANDATMDIIQSQAANIVTDFEMLPNQSLDLLPSNRETTVRFSTDDAAMDVMRSPTINIATDVVSNPHSNVNIAPPCGVKMETFSARDAAMDKTQCLTENVDSNTTPDSALPHQKVPHIPENVDFTFSVRKRHSETHVLSRSRSSTLLNLDQGFQNTVAMRNNPKMATNSPSPQISGTTDILVEFKRQESAINAETKVQDLDSAIMEKSLKTTEYCPETNINMDNTEAQTECVLEQTYTDESFPCRSSTQEPDSGLLKEMNLASQNGEELGFSNPKDVRSINIPDSLNSNETENKEMTEPKNTTSPSSQEIKTSPCAVDQDVNMMGSKNSRRKSLADLQSKLKRLSQLVNTAPYAAVMDNCTATLPQTEQNMDKNSKDEIIPQTVAEPEFEVDLVNAKDNAQEEHSPASTGPFGSKTKRLMSRISVGGFKPKLPQRPKPEDSNKVNPAGEHKTITVSVASQLGNLDNDVSDIYDEELASYEDESEILDTRSPQKFSEKGSPSQEFYMVRPLEDKVFEDHASPVHGQKRSLPDDENKEEDEKRRKASSEIAEMVSPCGFAECGSNVATSHTTIQTTDSSATCHSASIRSEAASESTFKHSMFESQLEDYASDIQKKFEDGTITVSEFFKLFNIDFFIHRQSVLPSRGLSDADVTQMDSLKNRRTSRLKEMVYDTDVQNLSEKVEGLKVRMCDLDKPLKLLNSCLWEEMRYSSEKELKSFGAKLKERNRFFRKMSKDQSHEMKVDLYSNVVQFNLNEQQKLRGTIQKADEMIKDLDDCIHDLEMELAAVEEKGFENKPGLNSLQEEMEKVTASLSDNDRQISELEIEKKQSLRKLNRLKTETRSLESQVAMLNLLNEWEISERTDSCTVYTFLHKTMHLQLAYEKSDGNSADGVSDQRVACIDFELDLDDEKSQFHAHLVHRLVAHYIKGESGWVEKYPTSRYVPKLLHDVSLVVSHCRLLGEELRLLEMWGGLRLDICNIRCVDTQVSIVFSSLKKMSKFEVNFAISLTNHHYVLHLESFRNMIGSTTVQDIEAIVASFSPAKNLLTKIVKKIHSTLLC